MDVQIADANFWRWTDAVSRFSGEAHDPWTRIVNVDLGITRMDSRHGNAIPTAKFNQVADGVDSDLERQESRSFAPNDEFKTYAEHGRITRKEQNTTRRGKCDLFLITSIIGNVQDKGRSLRKWSICCQCSNI